MFKKILLLCFCMILASTLALAGQGLSVWNDTKTLYSQATGTTVPVSTPNSNFDNTVQNIACSIYTGASTSLTVQAFGSAVTGTGYASLATATTNTTPIYIKVTGVPVNSMNLLITSGSATTTTINAVCNALQ